MWYSSWISVVHNVISANDVQTSFTDAFKKFISNFTCLGVYIYLLNVSILFCSSLSVEPWGLTLMMKPLMAVWNLIKWSLQQATTHWLRQPVELLIMRMTGWSPGSPVLLILKTWVGWQEIPSWQRWTKVRDAAPIGASYNLQFFMYDCRLNVPHWLT